jgi:DNA-binding transcriptional LysR family regulator
MELRDFRNFLAVFDSGSVGTAARSLGMSQPALTKAIRSFEASLGTPLFERAVTGTTPTLFGRALEPHARAVLNQADRAGEMIAELAGGRRGRVRVVSGPTFAAVVYPIALPRFHQSCPKVEVSHESAFHEEMVPALREGRCEIAFGMLGPHTVDDAVATETLVDNQPVIVVGGPEHPLSGRRRVSLHEVLDYPWALTRPPGLFRVMLAERFAHAGLPAPSPAAESASSDTKKRLVLGGGYLGMAPELSVREEIAKGSLCEIRVPELGWSYAVGALYLKAVPLSPAAQQFIEVVRAVSRELGTKRRR